MNSMWKTAVATLAWCVVALSGGCSRDEPSDVDDAASDAQDIASDASAADGGDDVVDDMPESAFNQLKDMWALQITGPMAQTDTLRQIAAQHNDAQLNDLIAQLDRKNTAIKAMFDGATYPEGARTLQVDIPKAMGEAGELVAKASQRMQEVVKASIPTSPAGGG